jgi:hypothetical protein
MQKSELHDNQEPEEAHGPARDQQVLQGVPQAHAAQRSEVAGLLNRRLALKPRSG